MLPTQVASKGASFRASDFQNHGGVFSLLQPRFLPSNTKLEILSQRLAQDSSFCTPSFRKSDDPASQPLLLAQRFKAGSLSPIVREIFDLKADKERFERISSVISDETSTVNCCLALKQLMSSEAYSSSSGINIPERKRLDVIAKSLAVALRRNDSEIIKEFLSSLILHNSKTLLPDSIQLIESHFALLDIKKPIKISTAIGVYEGQIAIRTREEHPDGEDALRLKIMQHFDYYGLNPLIDWEIIYINNGDDRYADNPWRQERTTSMIMEILQNEYPDLLSSGKVRVYEFDHELREAIGSVHGGCTIFGMRKALDDKADIVIHNNVDLDCHTALTGNLVKPIVDENVGITIAANKVKGGIIRDYNRIRTLYSRGFNLFTRFMIPIGKLRDPQNAFKAFSKEALEQILPFSEEQGFEKSFDYHFSFPNQLITRARHLGFGVQEIPSLKHWSARLATPKPIDTFFMIGGIFKQRGYHKIWKQQLNLGIPPETIAKTREFITPDGITYVTFDDSPLPTDSSNDPAENISAQLSRLNKEL